MRCFSETAVAATRSFLFALLTGVSTAALSTQAGAQQLNQSAENQEQLVAFDIAPQPLSSALSEFARQAGVRALYPTEQLRAINSPGLHGSYTREEGLVRLLENSGHRASINQDNVIELESPERPQERRADAAERAGVGAEEEEIIVVGTNIRGVYPSSSPVEIYTAEDIARTGAATTEQFVGKLPQNLGTRTQYAAGTISSANNFEAVTSLDIRGLGVSTTLTLLNGRRLALASSGQAADVSLIPVRVIERVEVLTDGASAIYGSDAIGGVVNFVLRDDFEGAETTFGYGGVTSGSLRQGDFSQLFGDRWGSGNVLVSYDFGSASALERSDRDFARGSGEGTLTPHLVRHSALATITQNFLDDRITLSGDLLFSKREVKTQYHNAFSTDALSLNIGRSDTQQYFANFGIDYRIADALSASLLASYSEIEIDSSWLSLFGNGTISNAFNLDTNHDGVDLTAMLSGTLFELPAGPVKFSLGGGYYDENYIGTLPGGTFSNRPLGRSNAYVFGEVFANLVNEDQNVPLVHRLELSLAARYTNYDDTSDPPTATNEFGANTSPRMGLLWAPTPDISIRGTYSESFRAPTLAEIDPSTTIGALISGFPVGGVPSQTYLLTQLGPSTELEAETADSFTIGFDFRPSTSPRLGVHATYFSVDYQNRVAMGDSTFGVSALANPSAFPEIIFRTSSASLIEEYLRSIPNIFNFTAIDLTDLQAASAAFAALSPNFWILDNRNRNLASSKLDGVDISIANGFDTLWGEISYGGNISRILDYTQQITQSSPVVTVVDTVLRPADLRGRIYVGLKRDGLDAMLSVNYSDDYNNPFAAGGPQEVASWTTADLSATYEFRGATGLRSSLRLTLSVQNLFDEDPPFVGSSGQVGPALQQPVGFDPTNANPLGRLLVVGVSKTW